MKIAIVHEWLDTYAGSERVLEQILELHPDADLYASVDFMPDSHRAFLKGRSVRTSFVQNLPFASRLYRKLLPLVALGIENLDLSAYDVVISNSHAVAKGVLTGPDQLHICYCHSPMRYAWDMQHQYLREASLTTGLSSVVARLLLHYMRFWDLRTVNGVDAFVCNSHYIARRIQKVYRRQSTVIYPPVNVTDFSLCLQKDNFYLTASRMVPYKKVNVVVEAFRSMPEKTLIVIGDGPLYSSIQRSASKNVKLLGYQPFSVLRDHLQKAKAFVFAAEEDFGILPVEAQACGTPVIGFGRGGTVETVMDGHTGILFSEQTPSSIADAIRRFEQTTLDSPEQIRQHAEQFSEASFRERFAAFFAQQVGNRSAPVSFQMEHV